MRLETSVYYKKGFHRTECLMEFVSSGFFQCVHYRQLSNFHSTQCDTMYASMCTLLSMCGNVLTKKDDFLMKMRSTKIRSPKSCDTRNSCYFYDVFVLNFLRRSSRNSSKS